MFWYYCSLLVELVLQLNSPLYTFIILSFEITGQGHEDNPTHAALMDSFPNTKAPALNQMSP